VSELPLPTIFGAILAIALLVYALSAGADFGGGIWDLLASGPRRALQRERIAHAIGPIWEANHVWMILVVVILFVCFPPAFAAIMTALHVPIAAMLVGITLRGAAFVFRAYGPRSGAFEPWGVVFAASSAMTPILLGVVLGAVASGSLRLDARGEVVTDFVSEWLAPFPWLLGTMTLCLFAYLAAVYLTVETQDEPALADDFRLRAMLANAAFGVSAGAAGWAASSGAPHLAHVLAGDARGIAMQALLAAVALGAMAALHRRRYEVARVLAMLQITLVFGAWVTAQGGDVLVGALSLEQAAAPRSILAPVLAALLLGSLVLVPAFVLLYRTFKGRAASERNAPAKARG
jgi:cytochrome d ubiquinol oxidase subunit II